MNNRLMTMVGAIASMFSVDIVAGNGSITTKVQTTPDRYRRGTGTAFTKGKRHRSQKIRANRRKAKKCTN